MNIEIKKIEIYLERMTYDGFTEEVLIPCFLELDRCYDVIIAYSGNHRDFEISLGMPWDVKSRVLLMRMIKETNDFRMVKEKIDQFISSFTRKANSPEYELVTCEWSFDGKPLIAIKVGEQTTNVFFKTAKDEAEKKWIPWALGFGVKKPYLGFTQDVLRSIEERLRIFLLLGEDAH